MVESELGYHVDKILDTPGQDPLLRPGDFIVAIGGERLLGLPDEEVEDVFGANFRDGADVILINDNELREACIERDSNEECPCEEDPGENGGPEEAQDDEGGKPEDSANYELLRRQKSSTEYPAVVRIPVGRSTAWRLPDDTMATLEQDLAILGGNFGITATPGRSRDGDVECVMLEGLSTAIAAARPEVIKVMAFYRECQWQSPAAGEQPPRARDFTEAWKGRGPEDGGDAGGDAEATQGAAGDLGDHIGDLRQFMYHDHTADIIVHSWGRTMAEAFEQVCVGMFQYMTELDRIELRRCVEVEASGHDLLDLLYHLLDEFLFVFCTEMHISRRVEIVEFDEAALRIRAKGYGESMDLERHEQGTEIKAITMHMMRILGPESVITENGAVPRVDTGEAPREGFPHEVYVLLDI